MDQYDLCLLQVGRPGCWLLLEWDGALRIEILVYSIDMQNISIGFLLWL